MAVTYFPSEPEWTEAQRSGRQDRITEAVRLVRSRCLACKVTAFAEMDPEGWAKIHELQIRDAFEELTKE